MLSKFETPKLLVFHLNLDCLSGIEIVGCNYVSTHAS